MKSKIEFQNHYGNHMTKKKLYCGTCIRLHNEIMEVNGLYIQFCDCESSDLITENIKKARELLKVAFDEALNEAKQKQIVGQKMLGKLEKSAQRYFKAEME